MLHQDFIRLGFRAFLDGDEELLQTIDQRYSNFHAVFHDVSAMLADEAYGRPLSRFWTDALAWLKSEVSLEEAVDAAEVGSDSFFGPLMEAGFAAMGHEDAPEDGWYIAWLGEHGGEHRSKILRNPERARPTVREVTEAAVKLVGVFHDDYFPQPDEAPED
jgi:hypothetical protein